MHLDEGITRFKCATIAEAEMAARAGAPDVLLAVSAGRAQRGAVRPARAGVSGGAVRGDRGRHGHGRCAVGGRGCRRASRWTCSSISTAACAGAASRRAPGRWSCIDGCRPGRGCGRPACTCTTGTSAGADVDARRQASDDAFAHVETMRQAITGGRARRAVRRRRGHAGLPVPRAAHRRRVQPGDDGLLGCRLRRDAAGSPVRAGGRAPHARDQQTGGQPAVPGPRAQGGRGREPASARGAVRARGRDGGRPQRGAPGPRDRPRRRLPRRHGGLRRALARVPDGGAVQRRRRRPGRPGRRAMAGRGPRPGRSRSDDVDTHKVPLAVEARPRYGPSNPVPGTRVQAPCRASLRGS